MTRSELNFWMGLAFDLNEAETSLVLKNKEINVLNGANKELRLSLAAKQVETDEQEKKAANYKKDFESEHKKVDAANAKASRGKTLNRILGILVAVETVYIGVLAAVK